MNETEQIEDLEKRINNLETVVQGLINGHIKIVKE